MRRLHLLRSHKITKALSKQRVSLINGISPTLIKWGFLLLANIKIYSRILIRGRYL